MPRRFVKGDALIEHMAMIALEIVRVQKQEYATAGLVADARTLFFRRRFGEQQRRPPAVVRRDEHPALAAAEIGVADKVETQAAPVPPDRLPVIAHDKHD